MRRSKSIKKGLLRTAQLVAQQSVSYTKELCSRSQMPTLVAPDGRIWRISSKEQLKDFCKQRGIGAQLEGNLGQLLEFGRVGAGRTGGRERGGYFRLDTGSWFRHPSLDFYAPVFGSAPLKYAQLCANHSVACSLATFKRLIETPGRASEDGWYCVKQPAGVDRLADGASVRNISAVPVQIPDFSTCSLGTAAFEAGVAAFMGARVDLPRSSESLNRGARLGAIEPHARLREHTSKFDVNPTSHARAMTESGRLSLHARRRREYRAIGARRSFLFFRAPMEPPGELYTLRNVF